MRTKQPLLVVCLWATFLAVNGRETVGLDRNYGSWSACQGPVCNEVQRQAEGLTRLKLLRNYVVQTMQLMDSLVTSLDKELVKTGQGLVSFVGHRCEEVHPLLQHVIQTNVSPDRLNNAELREDLDASESSYVVSSGQESEHIRSDEYEDWNNEVQQSSDSSHKASDVLLEASSSHSVTSVSSSTSSVGGQSSTNKNIGKQLKKGSAIKRGPYVAPSQPGGREIVYGQGGTGSGFGGGSSGSGGSGSGFGGGSSGSGGSGSGFGGGSSGSGGSGSGFGGGGSGSGGSGSGFGGGGSGSGGSGSGFGGGSSGSGGSGSGFGGGGSGSGGSGSGFGGGGSGSGGSGSGFGGGSSGSGGSGSGFGGGGSSSGQGGSGSGFGGGGSVRQCRGVSQESPFWVPGLDDWCVNNCAAGYCPSTHCVC